MNSSVKCWNNYCISIFPSTGAAHSKNKFEKLSGLDEDCKGNLVSLFTHMVNWLCKSKIDFQLYL